MEVTVEEQDDTTSPIVTITENIPKSDEVDSFL